MKSGIEKIVGKTIKAVVVTEKTRNPRQQLFLVFTDGTSLELYGDSFQCTNNLWSHDVGHIVSSAEHNHAEKIEVFEPDKED